MKRIRITGLCLVVAFAISAVGSSVASAAPVFVSKAILGQTVATHIPITATLGAAFLEAKSGTKITCTGGTSTGEITSSTTAAKNVSKFTGCESGGNPCENAAAKEIVTKPLAAVLGGITTALPGERLFDEGTGKGGILAEFKCAGVLNVIVHGSLIGSLSGAAGTTATAAATGKLNASGKLTFAESAGIQKYSKFAVGEGEAGTEQLESSIGGGAFEKSGQSVIATIKTVPATYGLGVTK
jgi:hypothetical protein